MNSEFLSTVEIFLTHLQAERGLILNTVKSYKRDLHRFGDYLSNNLINYSSIQEKKFMII